MNFYYISILQYALFHKKTIAYMNVVLYNKRVRGYNCYVERRYETCRLFLYI